VEYSLRALPLGGYVAFPDNDEDCPYPEDDPNLLKNRPILDRFFVISAGTPQQLIHSFGDACSPAHPL
jgi:membrane-associated protease RseP (regulator of RpoE activity)